MLGDWKLANMNRTPLRCFALFCSDVCVPQTALSKADAARQAAQSSSVSTYLVLLALMLICVLASTFSNGQVTTPVAGGALHAVILGSGSPQFDPKRGSASVLVRMGDTEILVDIGNGTQARLYQLGLPISALDGLLFTHQHLDHNEEFIPVFIRALLGNNRFLLAGPAPMRQMAGTTLELYKQDIEYRMRHSGRTLQEVKNNYTVSELTGGESFAIGAIKVTTVKVNHTIAATAMRFDAGGRSIVVTGDLTYTPALSELAKAADYLIIDSGGTIKTSATNDASTSASRGGARREGTRREGARREGARRENAERGNAQPDAAAHSTQRAHVTLAETAKMARDAGVKTLVLTHFTPGVIDEAATIAELRKSYQGKIVFATDLMRIEPRNSN